MEKSYYIAILCPTVINALFRSCVHWIYYPTFGDQIIISWTKAAFVLLNQGQKPLKFHHSSLHQQKAALPLTWVFHLFLAHTPMGGQVLTQFHTAADERIRIHLPKNGDYR